MNYENQEHYEYVMSQGEEEQARAVDDEARAELPIRALLERLGSERQKSEVLRQELAAKKAAFDEKHHALLDGLEHANEMIERYENAIRKTALDEYAATGNKKLEGGVSIKVMTRLEYDAREAFTWAIDHHIALSLDKKAFEAIAKTSLGRGDLTFVTAKETPTATIPTIILPGGDE